MRGEKMQECPVTHKISSNKIHPEVPVDKRTSQCPEQGQKCSGTTSAA